MRKRFALPVLSSNALSSVAYSPDEILLTLSVAGLAAQGISPWVGLAVVVVLAIVVASYRQTVRAYPSGGGDYTVTRDNLGPQAGVTAAGALLVDHVLTLAVSVAAAVHYLTAALPALRDVQVPLALVLVAALTMVNLRGLGDARAAFAGVVYLFMATVTIVVLVGVVQHLAGTLGQAPSAELAVAPESGYEQGLVGAAGALVVLRAFSSGGAALTGVETISTRVPSFRRPRGR
ncbi:amino acid permease, partial [Georgenia sp. 10Sc9-8]|nr:amino acid permease [Georgenia halotolerans]